MSTIFNIFRLGMKHDGDTNDCPPEGHVMSISKGAPIWSSCSAKVAANAVTKECLYDGSISNQLIIKYPGKYWTTERQCRTQLG